MGALYVAAYDFIIKFAVFKLKVMKFVLLTLIKTFSIYLILRKAAGVLVLNFYSSKVFRKPLILLQKSF